MPPQELDKNLGRGCRKKKTNKKYSSPDIIRPDTIVKNKLFSSLLPLMKPKANRPHGKTVDTGINEVDTDINEVDKNSLHTSQNEKSGMLPTSVPSTSTGSTENVTIMNSPATKNEKIRMINKLNAQIQNLNTENQYVKGLSEKIISLKPSEETAVTDTASRLNRLCQVYCEMGLLKSENAKLRKNMGKLVYVMGNNGEEQPNESAENTIRKIDTIIENLQKQNTDLKDNWNGVFEREETDSLGEIISTLQSNTKDMKSTSQTLKSFMNLGDANEESPEQVEIKKLRAEVANLRAKMNNFSKFLDEDQMRAVSVQKMSKWSTQTIVKALKFRLGLGVHGYKFLLNSGYPFLCLETLGEKLRALKINCGIFSVLEEPLKAKVAGMSQIGRCCTISIDEMQINPVNDYDKFEKKFVGSITLDRSERKKKKKENEKAVPVEDEYDCLEDMLREDEGDDCKADKERDSTDPERKDLGTHLITVLARGISSPWKQVIAIGITSGSTKPQALHKFVDDGITFLENCGLYVTSLTSDMGTNNCAFWTRVGVKLQHAGDRKNFFMCNGHKVYLIADPRHLLKNLKLALLSGTTTIPEFIREAHSLPTTNIEGSYVEALWHTEVNMKKELRKLHHLHFDDLHPDNFKKMHVGSAVRFFSHATAAALEDAVEKKILSKDALTTAWFIRKVNTWFAVVSSRERKTSITRKNRALRYLVLTDMMDIFENVRIKGTKWKPLNAGMVLSCLSLVDICEYLFSATSIDFVLLSRFSQDALENVFSQVRRKAGKTPTALQCQKAMKLISVSQFVSKIDHTSYHNDADVFLIDFFSKKNDNKENGRSGTLNDTGNNDHSVSRPVYEGAEVNFSQRFETVTHYNDLDAELLCNLSGIVTKAVLKKHICQDCRTFLSTDNVLDVSLTRFISRLDKGGLKVPNKHLFHLICNAERIYQKHRSYILHNCNADLQEKIEQDIDITMPNCCFIKKLSIEHFFKIRCFAVTNNIRFTRPKRKMYGTSTAKSKKVVN